MGERKTPLGLWRVGLHHGPRSGHRNRSPGGSTTDADGLGTPFTEGTRIHRDRTVETTQLTTRVAPGRKGPVEECFGGPDDSLHQTEDVGESGRVVTRSPGAGVSRGGRKSKKVVERPRTVGLSDFFPVSSFPHPHPINTVTPWPDLDPRPPWRWMTFSAHWSIVGTDFLYRPFSSQRKLSSFECSYVGLMTLEGVVSMFPHRSNNGVLDAEMV